MNKVAIIGAGISGVSIGRMLHEEGFDITVFESKSRPGGLIQCSVEDGNLFHRVGGHVFNTKNHEVENWFWSIFNRNEEFHLAQRNAKILIDGQHIGYPIEDHLFELKNSELVKLIIKELIDASKLGEYDSNDSFASFLRKNFGKTLYDLYFQPYNEKIWKINLEDMPLSWLDGKLPMPKIEEIFLHNFLRKEESEMVHSKFYYPKNGGSQFVIEKIASGLNIQTNTRVLKLERKNDHWIVNENHSFDYVIYTGDIRLLAGITNSLNNQQTECLRQSTKLRSNGTSTMLCYTDPTDISWLYLPDRKIDAHRIIYTGNFSKKNNQSDKLTCTVEFSGEYSHERMINDIKKLPGNLQQIAWNYEANSYVIQENDTKRIIQSIKTVFEPTNLFILGRFAEWEYYNMDKCIEKSLDLTKKLKSIQR